MKPHVRVLGSRKFELVYTHSYTWVNEGVKNRITIPSGFVFDYASVPRILHTLVGRLDLGLIAPLYHDWIYRHGGNLPYRSHERYDGYFWRDMVGPWTRKDADRLFGRHMREEGVVVWRRRAAYRAVRLFGFFAWRG